MTLFAVHMHIKRRENLFYTETKIDLFIYKDDNKKQYQ